MIQKETSTTLLRLFFRLQVPQRSSDRGKLYAALRPLVVVAALVAFAAFVAAARTDASAKLTTCFVAFENWSNAAVVAATVDLSAVTATSEPAGAFLAACSTHAATFFVYMAHACSASAEKSACASEAI
jgi:hypothetical protein